MAHITRIKAGKGPEKASEAPKKANKPKTPSKPAVAKETVKTAPKAEKTAKLAEKAMKSAEKAAKKPKKPAGKVKRFFTAPFRYIHNSWLELRQVRWPSRGATWKMVLAVFFYAALIMAIIMLLDVFFTWLFNLVLGQ